MSPRSIRRWIAVAIRSFPGRCAIFATSFLVVAGTCTAHQNGPSGTLVLPSHPTWLTLHEGRGQVSTPDLVSAYYSSIGAVIGPNFQLITLEQFKHRFGFDAGDTARAVYFNAGDLEFGRDMHCIYNGILPSSPLPPLPFSPAAACYVTNYGKTPEGSPGPGGDPHEALNDAIDGVDPIATVAMTWGPTFGDQAVRFYVFDANGQLSRAAVLDSEGAKFVPTACTSCHGGKVEIQPSSASSPRTPVVTGASFLPFDVFSFGYSDRPGYSMADQQEAFRRLNEIVKETHPNANNPNDPIVDFIQGMYGGNVNVAGAQAQDTYVPVGWRDPFVTHSGDRSNYYDVIIAPYCRTCHLARQDPGLDFTQFRDFLERYRSVQGVICGSHLMPHAEVPFKRFWLNPHVDLSGFMAQADPSAGLEFPAYPDGCRPPPQSP
jgi:hypothetical protein